MASRVGGNVVMVFLRGQDRGVAMALSNCFQHSIASHGLDDVLVQRHFFTIFFVFDSPRGDLNFGTSSLIC